MDLWRPQKKSRGKGGYWCSVTPHWGFPPFSITSFLFVANRKIPQSSANCSDAALHKRSACCIGKENWKKQGTGRGNSSSLVTKNGS